MPAVIITHTDCLAHHQAGHVERPERLQAVLERLRACGLAREMGMVDAIPADRDTLASVHPRSLVDLLCDQEPDDGIVHIDPDTFISKGSIRAAQLAAGAGTQAVDKILAGDADRVFCAVRPPGHHAERAQAMGFCLFNSVAIAATYALEQPSINRVAILDFDVHHCNGTVDLFRDRHEVLVCSSFQDHHYPGRYLDFTNEHIINTPLAAGAGSREFRDGIETSWLSAVRDHRPDLILVSAGFDAHARDPLAEINLGNEDFAWIGELIRALADELTGGRIIATLEGGYDLAALADSVEQFLPTLR
jgi:acetoin utilization deacetylase AcuC-like enzyme